MSGRDVHRAVTLAMSLAMLAIGAALIVRTLVAGGGAGAIGIVLGVLFVAAGAGRLWVAWRTPR
ncbi:MAG TPA: hypothetical protein VNZ62_09525 [Capillimicrobium sp.]|nr:hypothetical protein [Capillimicrobium sp.]